MPKRVSSLEPTIHAHIDKTLLDDEVRQLIGALEKANVLTITNGKFSITWHSSERALP